MRRLCCLLAIALFAASPRAFGQAASRGGLTIDALLDIRHPSDAIWSPDNRHVAFMWERAGIAHLFVADAGASGAAPRQVTNFEDGEVSGVFWSADGRRIYFSHDGDLWQAPVEGGAPAAVWTTPARENGIRPSPDGRSVVFTRAEGGRGEGRRSSDLWVRSLQDGREVQVTDGIDGIGGASWSPDGMRLAFSAGGRTIRHDETPPYSGSKIIFTINERVPGTLYVVSASGGTPTEIKEAGGFGGGRWLDATHLLAERRSGFKTREIRSIDVTTGASRTLYTETDPKFLSMPGQAQGSAQASPDGKWIAFLSDKDGWDHLYVMPAAGGDAVQITRGHFEAWRPSWSPDSTRVAFDANDGANPGIRHLKVATLGADPAHARIDTITTGVGTDTDASWSPDGRRLLVQHTDPHNSADYYAVDARAGATPVRLSDSMPAGIDRAQFVEPEFIHYPGPDGKPVPAWLFVPKNLDRSRPHPAIVWIHGDGINQNYDGWHVQRNYAVYYSFHQYLLQQGYVVIAPDYRGSIGYGRDWRQGVYMDVGGNDYRDAANAADYLKTLPYVDADRIGVWGLSYGGFFTLLAVTDRPTTFACAIDVAGVADYEMYYGDPYHGGWTESRIGKPEEHPDVYAQASPMSHVDKLQRPLLILHGTADVNVPFLQSVALIDRLLKAKKGSLIDFMVYPGEFHYFTREHVLRDAWTRSAAFFDRWLKGTPGTRP